VRARQFPAMSEGKKIIFELTECVICREDGAVPSRVLEPCGHRCVCDTCLQTLGETTDLCPVCRQTCRNLGKQLTFWFWLGMILNLYIVFMLIRSFVVFDLDSITTLLVFQLLYGRTVKLIVDIERVYVWSGGVDLGIV
jgi:hypothetical protein